MADWRAISGYPGYHVSDEGEVKSYAKHKNELFGAIILRQNRPPSNPRARVCLYNGHKTKWFSVARLVCEAFYGPPQPRDQACHLDGDIFNDRASNLAWQQPIANMRDRDKHGRTVRGLAHHSNILWPDEAVAIRMRYDEAKAVSGRVYNFVNALAREYNVTVSCIEDIIYRRSWLHICMAEEVMRGSFPGGWCMIGGNDYG